MGEVSSMGNCRSLENRYECPVCGSERVVPLESFYPKPGGRFMCKSCGSSWTEE